MIFRDNEAVEDGGGISSGLLEDSATSLHNVNVTLAHNRVTGAGGAGGGIYNHTNSHMTVTNSIVWGNEANGATGQTAQISDTGSLTVTYSLVGGDEVYTGTGNITGDPRFSSATDLRLQLDSPAIDAGHNAAVPAGVTTDLAGEPRRLDVPTVADSGAGAAPLVDMGAYEATHVDVAVTHEVAPAAVLPGQPLTYTLGVHNQGTLTATAVVLTEVLPSLVEVTAVSSEDLVLTERAGTSPRVWDVGDLAPGAAGTVQVVGRLDPQVSAAQTVAGMAQVTAAGDLLAGNNEDQAATSLQVPAIGFARERYTVAEDGGTLAVSVALDRANPYAASTVAYQTADGTARAGRDYEAVSGQVTVPPGERAATIRVPLVDGAVADGDRTLQLALQAPTGAALATNSATATITDDDVVGVTVAPQGVELTGNQTSYTVVLTSQPVAPVTVAVAPDDKVSTTPQQLVFTADNWDVPQTVTVARTDGAGAEATTSTIRHTVTSEDTTYDGLTVDAVTVQLPAQAEVPGTRLFLPAVQDRR